MDSYDFFPLNSFNAADLTAACERVGKSYANAAKDIPGLIVAGMIVLHKDGNATPLLTLRKAMAESDSLLMDRYVGAMSGKTNGGKAIVTFKKADGKYDWPKGFRNMSLDKGAVDTLASFHGRAAFNSKAVKAAMLPTPVKVLDWDDIESAILKTIASKLDKAHSEGIQLSATERAELRSKVTATVNKALASMWVEDVVESAADVRTESDVVESAAAAA